MLVSLVLLPLIASAPVATASTSTSALWAGHAFLAGKRSVPLFGKVESRSESFVLAEVTLEAEGTITLIQRTCRIELSQGGPGLDLSLRPGAAERLPPVRLVLERRAGDRWVQKPAIADWSRGDVDGDGHPGLTIEVSAPLCSGELFVAMTTESLSRGAWSGDTFSGELRARSKQAILGTEGLCLSVIAKDSVQVMRGAFAYVEVPRDTTCASLARRRWPVLAPGGGAKQ